MDIKEWTLKAKETNVNEIQNSKQINNLVKFFSIEMKMFGTKLRSGVNSSSSIITGDETIRRVTREKIIVRGNKTIRTLDSTTSFLPIVER